jgi:hypothetical protein
MLQIKKYPRTQHIEGSKLQEGDEDLSQVPFSEIAGRHLVVEEKMDGANAAISFSKAGDLQLQSRGHYLTGGYRERHFNFFKTWASVFVQPLWEVLSDRYIMYGEWMYAKHTIFYTDLPHYFLEFDVFDTVEELFLTTEARRIFCKKLPFIQSVKVLHEGKLSALDELKSFITTSEFINQPNELLEKYCQENGLNFEQAQFETDLSGMMEGLYIKVEENGEVTERYKWVRHDFLQTVHNSGSHWLNRPIIPNQLDKEIDELFY